MRRPRNSNLPAPPELPSFTVASDPSEDEPADIAERHAGTGLERHDAPLDEDLIDPDAAKVVRRLERAGYQAYLVGGCVRDLLLNWRPKDFDVATNARPEDVRALFRNCRVIGRRFRLAHVLFGGGKVIEVATFRRNPGVTDASEVEDVDDLLIRSDNVFGEAHEDALRRDFTINALFYDLDRRQVLDWCGGLDDVKGRTIRTIGDAAVRFREDPVRMLRAIKFAARLDLGLHPVVYDAIVANRHELARAAKPRIFEEILRLLRGGAAHRSMWLLWEMGCMGVLLPELSALLDDVEAMEDGGERFFKRLTALDAKFRDEGLVDDVTLMATLLYDAIEEATTGVRDPNGAMLDYLDSLVERVSLPRRIADGVRRIMTMTPRLLQGRVGRAPRNEYFVPALDVLGMVLVSRGESTQLVDRMRREAAPAQPAPAQGRRPSAWPRRTPRHR